MKSQNYAKDRQGDAKNKNTYKKNKAEPLTNTSRKQLSDVLQNVNIKLIENKTLNNGYLNCNTIADHPYYANGIDKDIIFYLTGNGGAGTVIKVELEKVK